MGCHTWFYKKVNPQPTREDKINQFIERTNKWSKRLEDALSNDGFNWEDEDKWYPYGSKSAVKKRLEDCDWAISNANHYEDYSNIKNTEGEISSREKFLYNGVENWKAPIDKDHIDFGHKNVKFDDTTMCINGIYYSSVSRYSDIFRLYSYDTYVFSEEEMWDLINANAITINDGVKEKLKEFWSSYPDGMICFG